MQEVTDLQQLAVLYADCLALHLLCGPCAIAGVGLSCMVAYEVTTLLCNRGQEVQLLTVFESPPIADARLALPALDETVTSELLHVWCGLYQLLAESASPSQQSVMHESVYSQQHVLHESDLSHLQHVQQGAGQQLPALQDMLHHLYKLPSYEQQLEYVSTFRPAGMDPQLWDTRVHEMLSRVLHLMQLLHSYQPRDVARCPVLVVHRGMQKQAPVRVTDILAQIADDSWKHVAPALLPVMTYSMTAEATVAANSAHMVSTLQEAMVVAVQGRAAAEELQQQAMDGSLLAAAIPLNKLCPETR